MSRVSPTTESQILSAVDAEPRGHREVHARLDMWSDRTVKHVLDSLAERGIVEKTIEQKRGRFGFARYRMKERP